MLVSPPYATMVNNPVHPRRGEARYRVERKSRADEDTRKGKRRAYDHGGPDKDRGKDAGELDRYL